MSFDLFRSEKTTGTKILHLSSYNIANVPYLLSKGLNDHTSCRSICVTFILPFCDYIKYPEDYMMGINIAANEVVALIKEADIIHIHNNLTELIHHAKTYRIDLESLLKAKRRVILHGHGTYHRAYKDKIEALRKKIRFTDILATPDNLLLSEYPGSKFLPNPIDVSRITQKHKDSPDAKIFKMAHSPTNRTGKSTDYLEKVILPELKKTLPIESQYIYRTTNRECLNIRSQCVLNFDQILVGTYGIGVQESIAQQIIPIVRISKSVGDFINDFFGFPHPFLLTTETDEHEPIFDKMILDLSHYSTAPAESNLTQRTLAIPGLKEEILDLYSKLLNSYELREKCRKEAYDWLLKTHDIPVVAKRLEEYYEEMM